MEPNEDEGIFTVGEDIANTFCNGNFNQGVKELIELNISPVEFSDYLLEQADEMGMELKDMWYGHFGNDFWIAMGQSYYSLVIQE
jgi:hypothetical protein